MNPPMSPGSSKCMKCDKPATHKITKIVKGKVHDLFLCDEHARTVSPYLPSQKGDQGKLMELLQHFLKQQEELLNSMAGQAGAGAEGGEPREATPGAVCPNCGLAFAAYRKTLLLGCSDCYSAFADLLANDLRRMQGATSQQPIPEGEAAGRIGAAPAEAGTPAATPPQAATDEQRLAVQRKKLEEAIAHENFHAAAQIRDEIRNLETKIRRRAQKPSSGEGGSAS